MYQHEQPADRHHDRRGGNGDSRYLQYDDYGRASHQSHVPQPKQQRHAPAKPERSAFDMGLLNDFIEFQVGKAVKRELAEMKSFASAQPQPHNSGARHYHNESPEVTGYTPLMPQAHYTRASGGYAAPDQHIHTRSAGEAQGKGFSLPVNLGMSDILVIVFFGFLVFSVLSHG